MAQTLRSGLRFRGAGPSCAQAVVADAVQKQRRLSEQAASAAMDAAAATALARCRRAEVDEQAAINKQLMDRKNDMEWQLMSALSAAGMVRMHDVDETHSR